MQQCHLNALLLFCLLAFDCVFTASGHSISDPRLPLSPHCNKNRDHHSRQSHLVPRSVKVERSCKIEKESNCTWIIGHLYHVTQCLPFHIRVCVDKPGMDLRPPSPTKLSPLKRSSGSPTKSSSPSKSSAPDPNLRLHTNSICAKDTKLILSNGTLTLRSNSVIHPKVQVTSSTEGTVLGRCSVVNEKCVIEETVRIGDYVLIDAGCTITAKEIGDDCIIESAVTLGEGSIIGNNCRICAGESIAAGEVVPDGTVVFGGGRRRKVRVDQVLLSSFPTNVKSRRKAQEQQIAWLNANLPKANQVWRTQ